MPKVTIHHRRRKRKARVYYVGSGEGRYKIIEIPKKGGIRKVYVPADYLKKQLKNLAKTTAEAVEPYLSSCAHGFRPGRSVLTNAAPHVGYEWTLSCDLKDCFDHVTYDLVIKSLENWPRLSKRIWFGRGLESGFVDGIARQGMPTSPAYCNIALHPVDKEISKRWPDVVYTRYADDLSFSSNDRKRLEEIRKELPAIVEKFGFEIHPKKWRLQWSRFGRRVICGVAVDDTGMYASRRARRKLRAWQHIRPKSRRTKGLWRWVQGFANHKSNIVRRALEGL